MHAIDHITADTSGTEGQFTEGNVLGGVQATIVTSAWLNDIQSNVLEVLDAAGVTPTKGDRNDLKNSIVQLIAANTATPIIALAGVEAPLTGDGTTGNPLDVSFSTMSSDDHADLSSGIAASNTAKSNLRINDAAADAPGVVELATDAETIAGTDATRAVTPQSLLGALNGAVGQIVDVQVNVNLAIPADDDPTTGPFTTVAVPGGPYTSITAMGVGRNLDLSNGAAFSFAAYGQATGTGLNTVDIATAYMDGVPGVNSSSIAAWIMFVAQK